MRNVFFGIILYVLRVNGTIIKNPCEGLEDGTRLAHSTQCDRFIFCKSQRMYSVGRCPRGLHFNRRLGVCDFKLRARCDRYLPMPSLKTMSKASSHQENCCSGCNCCNSLNGPLYAPIAAKDMYLPDSNGPSTGPSGTTCNNKGICKNQTDGAMFPNRGSNGYIVCQCECEIPMPCPPNLIFNPILKVCDWPIIHPDTVSTTSVITTTVLSSTPKYPSSSDTSSTSSDTTEKFPPPTTSKVITTTTNVPSTVEYSSTLYTSSTPWDSTSTTKIPVISDIFSTTKYPTSSDTDTTSSDPPTNTTTSTISNPAAGPSGITCNYKGLCQNQTDGTMLPNRGSNGYIVCQCECEIPMPCPPNLIFNPILKVCDWPIIHPDTVSTSSVITTTVLSSTPKYPSSPDTSSTSSDTTENFPTSTTSKVITTTTNVPSTVEYSSTLYTSSTPWDSTSTTQIPVTTDISSTPKYTPSSDLSSTPFETTTKSATLTTSNPAVGPSGTNCDKKGVCENQPDGAIFSNPETNGYIVCQCECEIPMPCPSELIYNPLLKACDWPSFGTKSPNSPSTDPSSTVCNYKGKCNGQNDGTLFADPNTNGYIVCQGECAVIMPCPNGLIFNPNLNVCDWPQNK